MHFCPIELTLQKNASRQNETNPNLTHIQTFVSTTPWGVELVTIRVAESFICFSSWQCKGTRRMKAKTVLLHPFHKFKSTKKVEGEEIVF